MRTGAEQDVVKGQRQKKGKAETDSMHTDSKTDSKAANPASLQGMLSRWAWRGRGHTREQQIKVSHVGVVNSPETELVRVKREITF